MLVRLFDDGLAGRSVTDTSSIAGSLWCHIALTILVSGSALVDRPSSEPAPAALARRRARRQMPFLASQGDVIGRTTRRSSCCRRPVEPLLGGRSGSHALCEAGASYYCVASVAQQASTSMFHVEHRNFRSSAPWHFRASATPRDRRRLSRHRRCFTWNIAGANRSSPERALGRASDRPRERSGAGDLLPDDHEVALPDRSDQLGRARIPSVRERRRRASAGPDVGFGRLADHQDPADLDETGRDLGRDRRARRSSGPSPPRTAPGSGPGRPTASARSSSTSIRSLRPS